MADVYNMNIDQGSDYNLNLVYKNISGVAINLTNYTVRAYLKRCIKQTVADFEMTTENGRIILSDPTNGMLTIKLTNEETASLGGSYYYDLEIISNTNVVTRLIQGMAILDSEVTKNDINS